MRFKKVYGQSKDEECIFCGKTALCENKQGIPTCSEHKNDLLEDKKCVCGEYMEIKRSKWGPFFLCPTCGPKSLKKAEEMESGNFRLNKKFRKEEKTEEKTKEKTEEKNTEKKEEKIPTLEELEKRWDNE